MSTRATYTVKNRHGDQHHFYIHYDGYPEGAREYLKAALTCSNQRGGLACAFIRANDVAELTRHWSVHGDTEFHYDFEVKAGGEVVVDAFSIDADGLRNLIASCSASEFTGLVFVAGFGYQTVEQMNMRILSKIERFNDLYQRSHVGNASAEIHEVTAAIDTLKAKGVELDQRVIDLAVESVNLLVEHNFKHHTFESFWSIGSGSRAH